MDNNTKYSDKTDINNIMSRVLKGSQTFLEVIGEVVPFCSAAAKIIGQIQNNSERPDIGDFKNQVLQIGEKLDDITNNYSQINNEIEKLGMDVKFSKIEENIKTQYKYFTEILNEVPEFRVKKTEDFCDHYLRNKGECNLNELYDGVMGNEEIDILEIVKNYQSRDRHAMEEFCAHLGYLFLIGISALMAYASLTGLDVSKRQKEWTEKMTAVQSQMTSAIEYCIKNFEDQAKTDLQKFTKSSYHELLVDKIFCFLQKKYYWVQWSVKAYRQPKTLFPVFTRDTNEYIIGERHFTLSEADDLKIVVSYCAERQKIDLEQIQQTFTDIVQKGNTKDVAEAIYEKIPNSFVHVIKSSNNITEKNNFSDHCYYCIQNKNCHLFVHC
ncbi:protein rapunzel-like [Polypterus senegalus]|uniref:protein rapunzel-like n=1 Tax=Polypterus senegalus TaxID=55291 RepID=UPI0019635B0B|nr:protein rapunzel-like [Polypterus senegalus]XP_039608925.1 protein rapunzel-like [Polypterus senegalus]XP_039608933.1 protein rapunzel-like [Polypterus senegalus]